MKKTLLASVAVFALMTATPVLAADDQHHDHAGQGQAATGGSHSGGQSGGRHDAAPATTTPPAGGHTGGSTGGHTGGSTGGGMSGGGMSGGHHTGSHHDTGGQSGGATNNTPPTGSNSMSGSHSGHGTQNNDNFNGGGMSGRGHDNGNHTNGAAVFGIGGHGFKAAPGRHVDHNSTVIIQLRGNRSAPHHYHAGSYHAPHGYSYRRWTYGEFLPALYYTSDYWLNDYNDYDLPDAPPGTVWVRYGDDALLIDRYTGEIITVEYGVFY